MKYYEGKPIWLAVQDKWQSILKVILTRKLNWNEQSFSGGPDLLKSVIRWSLQWQQGLLVTGDEEGEAQKGGMRLFTIWVSWALCAHQKKHATCYGQMDLYQVYLCISKLLHDRMQSVGLHGKEMLSCWWIFIKRLLRRSHLSLYVPQKTCGAAGFHVYIRCQILQVPSGKWQIYSLRPQCVLDLPVCEGLSLS